MRPERRVSKVPSIKYKFVSTGDELASARRLMIEYRDSISTPLCFQNFDAEMDALPGKYAAPKGCIILAYVDGIPGGVIAVREIDAERNICEMKRLFVREHHRGMGLARGLCERLIEFSRSAGYSAMRLDTDAYMKPAQALYASLGFYHIEKYNDDPIPDTLFYERKL